MGRKGTGVDEHNGALRIRFTLAGRRETVVLRLSTGATMAPTAANLRYALRLADDVRAAVRSGSFTWARFFPHHARARDDAGSQTVGALLQAWLGTLRKSKSTVKSYHSAVNFWMGTPVGNRLASDLVKSDVLAALASRPELKGKTINNYLVALRQGLGLSVEDGRLAVNVARQVKSARVQRPEPDPFTRAEAEAIVADMRRHYPDPVWQYTQVKFWTGLRSSESFAVRWSDFDAGSRTLRVHRGIVLGEEVDGTKTRVARSVMLNSLALEALQAARPHTLMRGSVDRDDDFAFRDPRRDFEPWHKDQYFTRWYWIPTLRRLGLRYRPPYNTRHTYATQLLMAGRKPAWAAAQLGHDLKMFLTVYARWIPSDGDAAEMAAFEAELRADEKRRGAQ